MNPQTASNRDPKSIIVGSSRITPTDDFEGIEEAEIAAEISVPTEGGWGWVVVLCSFTNTCILDGVFFTFGSIFKDMTEDMQVEATLIALINSIAVALYFLTGPITSALINRFGFRLCTMSGSVLLSLSFVCSYFATNYITLLSFYGIVSGFGACLVAMPSSIIVGFYFERLRAIALAIAGTGSSVGIMVMFSVNSMLVNSFGWRITTLVHAALFGTIYFISMTYRPLLSLTVTTTVEDPTRTLTYLPSLASTQTARRQSSRTITPVLPTAAERLFSAVSNAHFPTAASVLEEGIAAEQAATQAGPSAATVSKLTLVARSPKGGISTRQKNQVQSMMSRGNIQAKVQVQGSTVPKPTKKKWWARCCHWEEHVPESRPMYRDDAFYDGRLEQLPVYQKSVMDTSPEARTGLEYQMAVSRAVLMTDLEDQTGVFTTAARRVLATMMDPKLLKRCSFLLICFGGFLTYVGLLIPYVFLPDRAKSVGIPAEHCSLFVSVIGFCNAIGRLTSGGLAIKFSPLILYLSSNIIAGIGIMAFNFSFELIFQYICCVVFGLFIASVSSIRSMVLVELYGLDKLTNATGMLLLFQGLGSLLSTPLSSILKNLFGYSMSFYVAGAVISLSGIILIPVKKLVAKEIAADLKSENNKYVPPKQSAKPKKK